MNGYDAGMRPMIMAQAQPRREVPGPLSGQNLAPEAPTSVPAPTLPELSERAIQSGASVLTPDGVPLQEQRIPLSYPEPNLVETNTTFTAPPGEDARINHHLGIQMVTGGNEGDNSEQVHFDIGGHTLLGENTFDYDYAQGRFVDYNGLWNREDAEQGENSLRSRTDAGYAFTLRHDDDGRMSTTTSTTTEGLTPEQRLIVELQNGSRQATPWQRSGDDIITGQSSDSDSDMGDQVSVAAEGFSVIHLDERTTAALLGRLRIAPGAGADVTAAGRIEHRINNDVYSPSVSATGIVHQSVTGPYMDGQSTHVNGSVDFAAPALFGVEELTGRVGVGYNSADNTGTEASERLDLPEGMNVNVGLDYQINNDVTISPRVSATDNGLVPSINVNWTP